MRRVPRLVAAMLIVLTTIAQMASAASGVRIIAPPHQSGIVDPLSTPRNSQVATESRPRRFVSLPGFERADWNSDSTKSSSDATVRAPGRVQSADASFSPQSFEPHAVHGRAPPLSR